MSFTKWTSLAVMAGTALTLGLAGPVAANTTILTFGGALGLVGWSKVAGPSGQLFAGAAPGTFTLVDVTAPPAIYEPNVNWAFSGDFVAGSAKNLGSGIKSADFTNGSFSFTGFAGNVLSGTFSKGVLVSNNGALTFSVGGDNIQYTGGIALDPSLALNGNMSFGLSGTNLGSGGFGIDGAGNISDLSFSGQAGGSLDQSPVPEPGEWATIGILASGLTGLVLRQRRKTGKVTA